MTGAATATRPATHPNAEEQSLDQLMIRYQQADHEALNIIVARTSPMLLRFFQGPSVTRHYAEDLLQELWLRVHEARHSYRPERSLLPWLLAIARHTRVDTYRRLASGKRWFILSGAAQAGAGRLDYSGVKDE